MITLRRSDARGHADHGWLDARHTFSFAGYHDPDHMGFSELRVINEDRVQPGKGFGTHGHRDMEIITWVLEGTLQHRDNMGNGATVSPGEVQVMSAGTGVTHSEFNASRTEGLHLLQMWIEPTERATPPRYELKPFAPEELRGRLRLVVSPDGRDGSLTIGQDATLFVGRLAAGDLVRHAFEPGRCGWLQVARGEVAAGGEVLRAGDGAGIQGERELAIEGRAAAEVLLYDLP